MTTATYTNPAYQPGVVRLRAGRLVLGVVLSWPCSPGVASGCSRRSARKW